MTIRILRSLFLAAALVLLSSSPALAADTPEDVCDKYLAALKQRGMMAAPEFIHPDELERFKAMLSPIFQPDGAPQKELIKGFFGESATPETVTAMAPADFMRAFMSVADVQMKKLNVNIGETKVLGSIKEGETVHLVTRATVGAGELTLTQMEVVSLKPSGDTWRLLLSGRLEGMAQALRAQSSKR